MIAPPDGFANKARLQQQDAVDFIVSTVKANPHEVTLLVIGPATNIALAIRKSPEIVPLIKRDVYMAGAVDVKGNTTPAAEMNVWVDPEAARIVMRSAIPQALIPLDVTNITQLDRTTFEKVSKGDGAVAKLFADSWMAESFAKDADAKASVFDTLSLAYALDPRFATRVDDPYTAVAISFGLGYARTLGQLHVQPPPLLHKQKAIPASDNK